MDIKELVIEAHKNAVDKGFWEDVNLGETEEIEGLTEAFKEGLELNNKEINAIGNRLMLIVGEVAEAQEGLRNDDRENFKEEIADVCIRIFDLCGGLDIDLEYEIVQKMYKNRDRPYKHGKQF